LCFSYYCAFIYGVQHIALHFFSNEYQGTNFWLRHFDQSVEAADSFSVFGPSEFCVLVEGGFIYHAVSVSQKKKPYIVSKISQMLTQKK